MYTTNTSKNLKNMIKVLTNTINFKDIIETFTKTDNVGFYMIHLERAVDRLPLIKDLEERLGIRLHIFNGANGNELVKNGHPTICQILGPPATRTAGDIGCTVSHINICKDALSKKYDYIVIFEDDCVFTSDLSTLYDSFEQFNKLNISWDLFLLGMNSVKSAHIPDTNVSIVKDFNCTHACILNVKFMNELINTYQEYYNNNTTLPIDAIYSKILKSNKVDGYGFNQKYFIQPSGIFSYIIEGIRYH